MAYTAGGRFSVLDDALSPAMAEKVLERLGFSGRPAVTFGGLDALYRMWCRGVPFDNVRKRIALASGDRAPLPGGTAEDFFASWLAHGTGGTCWPTSNALYVLLVWCGFAARRISASMHEEGSPNHGSVVVRVDGEDFLVDSSMLTDRVIPLRPGERFEVSDPVHPIVAEPVEELASDIVSSRPSRLAPRPRPWRIWFGYTMSPSTMPCRLLEDPVDHAFYLERYEISRQLSPFNVALYARRNLEGGLVSFLGRTRFFKSASGIEARELQDDELERALVEELGLSGEMAARMREGGC
jgi:N-hydroxyarylamine O-acetyltransferase